MTSIFNQSGYRAMCLRYMIWHMTHFNQSKLKNAEIAFTRHCSFPIAVPCSGSKQDFVLSSILANNYKAHR